MASVSVDPRNGKVIVKVYAGKDPATGKQTYLRRSFKPGTLKSTVELAVEELEARAARMRGKGAIRTLDDMYEAFEDAKRGHLDALSTIATYRYRYGLLAPAIGQALVDEVKPEDVGLALGSIVGRGSARSVSPKTANLSLALLHKLYSWGMKEGIVRYNPADGVEPFKAGKRRDIGTGEVFTPPEVASIEDWAGQGGGWDQLCYRAAAMLALHTGMRAGETCALLASDVDVDGLRVTVSGSVSESGGLHVGPTKSGKPRTVAIDAALADHLRNLIDLRVTGLLRAGDEAPLLCTSAGGIRRPRSVSRAFALALAEMGIDHGRFHSLRHTHATMLAWNGVSTWEISKRLGHSSTKVTEEIYLHVFPAADRGAADAFARALEGGRHGGA